MSENEFELSNRESDKISRELYELKKALEAAIAAITPVKSEINEIDEEVASHRRAIEELARKKSAINIKIFDANKAIRQVESKVTDAERRLKRQRDIEALADEQARLESVFDDKIQGAYWREFAMDHQIKGARTLASSKRAILGDKRGLGKTLTSLIYADLVGAQKIICIVPKDVLRNFEREIKHWTPYRTVVPFGGYPKDQRDFVIESIKQLDKFIITLNYEAWRKDPEMLPALASLQADTIICDEAHVMKNTDTAAFKGVKSLVYAENKCPQCGSNKFGPVNGPYAKGCQACQYMPEHFNEFCSIQNVLPMTGTPILNKPQDLFALLHLVDRVNFAREYDFLSDYCEKDYYTDRWVFRSGGLDLLTRRLGNRYVARDRNSAGVVIPPQEIQIHDIDMDPVKYSKQAAIMKQINENAAILMSEDEAVNILFIIALITRKRQVATWPDGMEFKDENGDVYFTVDCNESIKLDEAYNLITELTDENERVVLFSQFKPPLKELERRLNLAGIKVVRYDGDTPKHIADKVAIDFDVKTCRANGREPKWQVVLANYKKGGVGLNFNDATQMIILDEEWNPGKVDQAYGRIDRIGQTRETTVHVLRLNNSIDTWMAGLIEEKANMIDGFESTMELQARLFDAIRNGEML